MTTMNINFTAFAKTVFTEMERLLTDYDLSEITVTKMNDLQLHGIVARRRGEDAGATVYLDGAFDHFMNGESIESIAKGLVNIVLNAEGLSPVRTSTDIDLSFDAVRDRLIVRMMDAERNREYLRERPHRFLSAGLVLTADIDMGDGYSIPVTNDIAREYDTIDLFDIALDNMKRRFPAKLQALGAVLMGDETNALDSDERIEGMYTLRNDSAFGASAISYADMDRIHELYGGDAEIFILPSSIYELILIEDSGQFDTADLLEMVRTANSTVVEPSDILSDHVYKYSAEGLRCIA